MVLVRIGLATVRFLVERLVVPQPHLVRAQQGRRGLAEPWVERERRDAGTVLPQVDALVERLLVGGALRK